MKKRAAAIFSISLCQLAVGAELATGKYVSTTPTPAGPPSITVNSVTGDAVSATFWWPGQKKSVSPCLGLHELAGSINGSRLSLSDAPGVKVVPGCEIKLELEINGPKLTGRINGAPREYNHE